MFVLQAHRTVESSFKLTKKSCICTPRCFTISRLFFHWLDTPCLTTTDVPIFILSDMRADFTKERKFLDELKARDFALKISTHIRAIGVFFGLGFRAVLLLLYDNDILG